MKVIKFSKVYIPTTIFSIALILVGIAGYFVKGGFNLGVDFKAGLIQEVVFAPSAFSVTYAGRGNAVISFNRSAMDITVSGPTVDNVDYTFQYAEYPTLTAITDALEERIEGIGVDLKASGSSKSSDILISAQGNPQLGENPFTVHYLEADSKIIDISQVRSSLETLGDVSVQVIGEPSERHFMIRMDEKEEEKISAEQIFSTLEKTFGEGEVLITRSDFVGSRFSKQLGSQAAILMFATLLVILIYATIRFKPQFAIGAVLAILHDTLIMVAFIAWTRMEFNTTTIAALLTILGYSINDTIVVFDRIRETRRIYPDETFTRIVDIGITETLMRTIITTFTTMLAVLSLYIFTTGSMKDFALALIVGMVSGVYSTIYIASGFTVFWENNIKGRGEKGKQKTQAKIEAAAFATE
ncbi:MAG: protein translocase subunit SecF [Termitinemataceae bacterium]|nr:MAG: protein translocase subunit SecF [Termitinemataceae bacterium]